MMCNQERTATALSVALQHPAVSSDPKNICKLLQTCKSWRAAVQQSSAGLTDVKLSLKFDTVEQPLQVMSSLSAWLPKCFGLLRRMEILTVNKFNYPPSGSPAVLAAVEALLAVSLQAGDHQLLQGVSRAGAAMVVQWGPRLQLQQYSSNVLTGLKVMSALPAAALTSLRLSDLESSSALTALSRFTALQRLDLEADSDVALPNISMLQHLTDLRLSGFDTSRGFAQLPVQLQQLAVFPLVGNFVADLQYLQQLQVLHFEVFDAATESWVLPAKLQQLTISCVGDPQSVLECYHISRLNQLKQVAVDGSTDSGEQLLVVAQMPQLQQVAMKYYGTGCLHNGAAQAWCRIPPLRALCLYLNDGITRDDLWQLVRHVAAVSQLRQLRITSVIGGQVPGAQQPEGMDEGLCKILSSMTSLQDLQLVVRNLPGMESAAQDMLHLTALKGLTRLQLHELQLDAAVATCLAVELTNLQWLKLCKHQQDWCVSSLPAINKLTRLKFLHCSTFSDAQARRGLSFLTGLTNLVALTGFGNAGEEAITEFWATLKHRQQ